MIHRLIFRSEEVSQETKKREANSFGLSVIFQSFDAKS